MIEAITFAIFFIFVCVVHELGHIIGYAIYNVVPDIRITWYGACRIGNKVMHKITGTQLGVIFCLGIITGCILILLSPYKDDIVMWFAYIIGIFFDVKLLVELNGIPSEDMGLKIPQIRISQARKTIQSCGME